MLSPDMGVVEQHILTGRRTSALGTYNPKIPRKMLLLEGGEPPGTCGAAEGVV